MRHLAISFALALAFGGCAGGEDEDDGDGNLMAPEPLPMASYVLSAKILGPVQHDDDADMEFTLVESEGVGGSVNFVRLTCSNGTSREWGAADIGDNRAPGAGTFVLVRHYLCPNSGRPREALFDVTDDNGFHHEVISAPYHPDWPGA